MLNFPIAVRIFSVIISCINLLFFLRKENIYKMKFNGKCLKFCFHLSKIRKRKRKERQTSAFLIPHSVY